MKFSAPTKIEWAVLAIVVLVALLAFFMTGCDMRGFSDAATGAAGSAAAGAASGAAVGGPWGALIGGGVGLLVGLGKALQMRNAHKAQVGELVSQKDTILADVTRGVGDFLEGDLNPADFNGKSGAEVATIMRQKLRDALSTAYTDMTRQAVREAKAP